MYICTEMNNTRFATVIHILSLLDCNPEEWLSSEWIANSININAVIVRKELGMLQEQGLVVSRKGKDGGSQLAKPSADVMLSDIYALVKNAGILGKKNQNPNPKCPVGKEMNSKLDLLSTEMDALIMESLRSKSLADFSKQFR